MTEQQKELGRLAHFAQSGGGDAAALERTRASLAQSKAPSTAASTSLWRTIHNGQYGERPFDATRVPLRHLEQMRRDPMIAFGLMFIKVFLARAPWYIKSTDPQVAGLVDGALRRIYGRFVLQYCGSLDFGYQGLVKNFERGDANWHYLDPDDPNGREIPVWNSTAQPVLWTPFTALNPRTIAPAYTKDGAFNGMYLRPYQNTIFPYTSALQPEVPLDWALWITNEKDSVFGSLWGYPRTAYAYRYWWAYWYRFGLTDRAFERWADPPIIAYHPVDLMPNADGTGIRDYTQEALSLAEELRSGANVSLPSGAVESVIEGKTLPMRQWELSQMQTTVDFTALNTNFEYLDIAKLRSLMVPEQAFLEGKGGTSSRNVASTLGDVFEEQQAVIKAEIDDQLNRYVIPQFVEANFGPNAPLAEIVTTGFDQADIQTARAVIQAFAQNDPARLSSVDFRRLATRLGLPTLNPVAAQKQADEMAAALAKAEPPGVPAKDGFAGTKQSPDSGKMLYYADGSESGLTLSADDVGFVERFANRVRREHKH